MANDCFFPGANLTKKSKSHETWAMSNKYITYKNKNSSQPKKKDTQADVKIKKKDNTKGGSNDGYIK